MKDFVTLFGILICSVIFESNICALDFEDLEDKAGNPCLFIPCFCGPCQPPFHPEDYTNHLYDFRNETYYTISAGNDLNTLVLAKDQKMELHLLDRTDLDQTPPQWRVFPRYYSEGVEYKPLTKMDISDFQYFDGDLSYSFKISFDEMGDYQLGVQDIDNDEGSILTRNFTYSISVLEEINEEITVVGEPESSNVYRSGIERYSAYGHVFSSDIDATHRLEYVLENGEEVSSGTIPLVSNFYSPSGFYSTWGSNVSIGFGDNILTYNLYENDQLKDSKSYTISKEIPADGFFNIVHYSGTILDRSDRATGSVIGYNHDTISQIQYRVLNEKPFISEWVTLYDNRFDTDQNINGELIEFSHPEWKGENRLQVRFEIGSKYHFIEEIYSVTHRDSNDLNLSPALFGSRVMIPDSSDSMLIEISGSATSNIYDDPEGVTVVIESTLVSQNGEFLDLVDHKEVVLDFASSKMPVLPPSNEILPWSETIRVEPGNNDISISYTFDFTSSNYSEQVLVRVDKNVEGAEGLATLTEITDFWITESNQQGGFATPEQVSFTGFAHNPSAGDIVLQGDLNEDGVDDFLTATRFGSTWAYSMPPATEGLQSLNIDFFHDEDQNATVLLGDLDQTGIPDILQITEDEVWISSTETYYDYPDPEYLQDNPFSFDPDNGLYLTLEDMTGDGDLDLVQVRPNESGVGEVWIMEFMQTKFDDPVLLGTPDFQWYPEEGWQIVFGDFNGDGLTDIAQNTPFRDVWVALAKDESGELENPTRWGATGYRIETGEVEAQWVFAAKTDDSGRDNLVLMNNIGEVWIAESSFDEQTGVGEFLLPVKSSSLGFRHEYNGGWQVYFGNFVDDISEMSSK